MISSWSNRINICKLRPWLYLLKMVGAASRLKPGVLLTQLHKTNIELNWLQTPYKSHLWHQGLSRKAFCHLRCFTLLVPWWYNGSWGTSKQAGIEHQCPFTLKSKRVPKHSCRPGFSPAILAMSFKADLEDTLALPSPDGIKAAPAWQHQGRLWSQSGLCYRPPLCQRDLFYFCDLGEKKNSSSWSILFDK